MEKTDQQKERGTRGFPAVRNVTVQSIADAIMYYYCVLLKSYPKYKIDRDRNKALETDKNIKT